MMAETASGKVLLGEKEREDWIWFHENAYKEDLKLTEELMLKSPRWSIVAGYYAMHDLTKLYLGMVKGVEGQRGIHTREVHRAACRSAEGRAGEGENSRPHPRGGKGNRRGAESARKHGRETA